MDCRHLVVATTLFAAGFLFVKDAEAALVSGDPIGTSGYHITGIDPGVVVDFTATASNSGNSNTIGKLTVTMSHANLSFLGFSLVQEAATQTSIASGGLRLLVDLVDTNAMTTPWTDYHIRAIDNTTTANPGTETAHLSVAHFHNTNAAFASNPLVLVGDGDNFTKLDFANGNVVNPGSNFTVSNILLHERDYIDVARAFRVEFAPSVPEPSTLTIFLGMGAAVALARRNRFSIGKRQVNQQRAECAAHRGLLFRAFPN